MKTPREILLERHQAAAPKLDAIRRKIVSAEFRRNKFAATVFNWLFLPWRELVLPSRRIWTGLAAVWVLILAANFSLQDHSQVAMSKVSPSPVMMLTFQQQEKMLGELFGQDEPRVAEPAKTFVPQPRSEKSIELLTA